MPIPFIPSPKVLQVNMIATYQGQRVENVYHVLYDVAPGEAERTAVGGFFHSWYTNNLKAQLHNLYQLELIRVVDLTSQNAPSTELVINPPETGLVGGAQSVASNAMVVTHRTGLRGRNYRGRTYVGGIPGGSIATAVDFDLTKVTNMLTAFTALLTIINVTGRQLVVLSKFLNKVPRGQGVSTPITGFSADTHVDAQRRRLFGRGI